jgi:hypothetical protein
MAYGTKPTSLPPGDYQRGYSKGYSAGFRATWPEHRPPLPPHTELQTFVSAARQLRDATDSICAQMDEGDEWAGLLAPRIDALDKAMAAWTEWMQGVEPFTLRSLDELLKQADALWPDPTPTGSYNYGLGRFPQGWGLYVCNSWEKWMRAGLRHDFRIYSTPEAAVQAFLDYVKENKVDVAALGQEA